MTTHMLPPMTIMRGDVDEAVKKLDKSFTEVMESVAVGSK